MCSTSKRGNCELERKITIPKDSIGNKLSLRYYRANFELGFYVRMYQDKTMLWQSHKEAYGSSWFNTEVALPTGEYNVNAKNT